jgi:hypothetical protein
MTRNCPFALLLAALACAPDDGSALVDDEAPATSACAGEPASTPDPFVDCVDAHEPAAPAQFGADRLPQVVLGPPHGGGANAGGTDVVSLGCGGAITVWFADPIVEDGPGVDFAVFENAFHSGDIEFVEPARVLVSDDGEAWYAFECDPAGDPSGCAGVTPVTATPDNGLAQDAELAGGDWFDLADVGLERARFVRIVDRTREHWDSEMWCTGAAAGFDLDAMAIAGPR